MKKVTTLLLSGFISSMVGIQAADSQMEQQMQVVQKLLEYGDARVVEHFEEFFTDPVRLHGSINNGEGEDFDLATLKKLELQRVAAISSTGWKLLQYVASGDTIACYLQLNGVHVGEFMGIPATGKTCAVPVVCIYRFHNGKICEIWNSVDFMALVKQLGEVHVAPKQESTSG